MSRTVGDKQGGATDTRIRRSNKLASKPNPYEVALVLHACIPDGDHVNRDDLFTDAARELGHKEANRKVRRSLNRALRAEMAAGRLETDWEEVWKPLKQ